MKKQYCYLIQLALILYLSCIAGETVEPTVQGPANQKQQRHHVSSVLLASGYVPIIISKPVVGVGGGGSTSMTKSTGNSTTSSLTYSADSIRKASLSTSSFQNISETLVPLLGRITAAVVGLPQAKPLSNGASTMPKVATSSTSSTSFNVLDLVGNLDVRLKHIRNIELGVTYIQEIFDAIGYTDALRPEDATINQLSHRIQAKLEVVHDILDSLSEFIGSNITETLRQQGTNSSNDEPNVFLNTLIQPCPFDDFTLEQNYNKNKIQILNYLKLSGFRDVDDLNFTINNKILSVLRRTAERNSSSVPTPSASTVSGFQSASETGSDGGKPAPYFQYQQQGITSNFKHVFFLSRNDHASDHNCQYYFNDLNFRHFYAAAIQQKHVFLLVDCGNSLTGEQLELSKQFVSNVIQMLSEDDTISIVTVDNAVDVIKLSSTEDLILGEPENTFSKTFRYNATMDRKDELLKQISFLTPSKGTTNHSLAFEYSFKLLRKQQISRGTPLVFVYVTRGLLSRFTEAMAVLDTVAKGQASLAEPIVINTCAVILDEKRIMYEKQFLQDIAQQNYSKYNIDVSAWYNIDHHKIRGNMFVITKRHPELIVKTSSAIFGAFFKPKYVSDAIKYHLPILDYNTKDVIVSITKPIPSYGVAGINMYLNDLAEDIIYYRKTDTSYAFITDKDGMVIYHPAFSRPVATTKTPYPVEIGFLEKALKRNESSNESFWTQFVTLPKGNETIKQNISSGSQNVTYIWHRILDSYIVCLVTIARTGNSQFSLQYGNSGTPDKDTRRFERYHRQSMDSTPSSELLYHRIDLIPPPKTPVCRHFRQIATLDTGTIFLSASAFKSPFIFFKNNREIKDETQRTHNAQSIMAYIKDITNLLANPGLQTHIRSDVSALIHVMSYLKKRHLENGALKKYIIRRYVATTNGVLQVYPGCILGNDLEPSRRPWFRKAVAHPGRIVATEPYLDAGGAGYIITIAHTIFEGKATALHNADKDLPIAVVALDVPYTFFYKMILESTPVCSEPNIKCLLMEEQGYLLAHPSMMEPSTPTMNNRRPLEHITHKESFVANDILNHKILVKKKACATFQTRVIQRYYEFNTSLTQVLTNNVVHGERTKYQITAVSGTNIFSAILNSTCDGGAFCPCSTVNRICLNCNRMDQADCECPCECPLRMPSSTAEVSSRNLTLGYCEPEKEGLAIVNSLSYDWSLVVKSCVNINCDVYRTHMECLGIMGCEWCQLDADMNPFTTPFCTAQNSCFNGLLGSTTPYGDGDIGSAIIEAVSTPAYSAIGPVGGTIIALCLMVGFAMYCYRQNLDTGSEHLYEADSIQDDNYGVPLSRLYSDDISPHDDSDLSGGGGVGGGNIMNRNHRLANAIAVNEVSPYHMSTGGYRRPMNGDSDHGYSTMTPHEDSEHMCFTLVEPLINNQKRLSMSADSMSINTSVSSPTNHHHCQPYHPQHITIDRPPGLAVPDIPSFPPNLGQVPVTGLSTPLGKANRVPERGFSNMTSSNFPPPGQTVLLNNGFQQISSHHILAPVTVHRHMEAS